MGHSRQEIPKTPFASRSRHGFGATVGGAWRITVALIISLLIASAPTGASPAQTPVDVHERAVSDARAGRLDEALRALADLVADHPGEATYLWDYIVVLGWAERDAEAVALLPRLDPSHAPAYVLESLAKSARNLGRSMIAVALLRGAVSRFPNRLESQVALAFALADANMHDEAERTLRDAVETNGETPEVLAARGYVAESRGDYFSALALYLRLLDLDPTNRAALRGRILMAARVHAPAVAYELALATPQVLRPGELEALHAQVTAAGIRWGAIRVGRERGAARFAETDAALRASDALAERALAGGGAFSDAEMTMLFDRLVALYDRYRMAEVVSLYDRLVADGLNVPPYGRLAVAEAHLYLEHPEAARDLYRSVLAEQPENFGANLGLFYALVESEDHDAAAIQIDRLIAQTPKLLDAHNPVTARPNPQYQTALAARSMAPAYADRLAHAEYETDKLKRAAPFSMPLRENSASVAELRGWPRQADEEFRWILAAEPGNGIADALRVSPLIQMNAFRGAEQALRHGLDATPEDKRVRLADDLWKVHNLRELYVEAGFGRSSGGAPTGTRDYAIDAWLYSAPLGYDWRAFAHTHLSSARFEDGPVDWRRLGAGVEYRMRDLRLTAEVIGGIGGASDAAAALSARWWMDDHLSVSGSLQSESNAIPLQARQTDIGGRSAEIEAVYRLHESREFAVGFEALDFSDGNVRTSAGVTWFERLATGPSYKLDLTVRVHASQNTLDDAPYFNPHRDFTPSVTIANDWLSWRRYSRSFRQRLSFTLGNYRQSGFGVGGLWGALYEHLWELDRRFSLRYGVGRTVRPYDGERTTRDFLVLTMDWRF
jgi:biofilm PGA synthesis protein PgaA